MKGFRPSIICGILHISLIIFSSMLSGANGVRNNELWQLPYNIGILVLCYSTYAIFGQAICSMQIHLCIKRIFQRIGAGYLIMCLVIVCVDVALQSEVFTRLT